MSGAEHYVKAEGLLRFAAQLAERTVGDHAIDPDDVRASLAATLAAAQVHATLALAAATAVARFDAMPADDSDGWLSVASEAGIAEAAGSVDL
jgi:hypothetical protein